MSKTMKCPNCDMEMTRGKIYGDRYALKWTSDANGLFLGIWARGANIIGRASILIGRASAVSFRCNGCELSVIPNDGKEIT